jgi:hypothetical protein
MDRNSVTALFLMYRRHKRRRNGVHWVHPIIKQGKNSVSFTHYLINIIHRDEANKFLNYFPMSISCFDELHRRLKESLQRRTSKMRNCVQPVDMLAVVIR